MTHGCCCSGEGLCEEGGCEREGGVVVGVVLLAVMITFQFSRHGHMTWRV